MEGTHSGWGGMATHQSHLFAVENTAETNPASASHTNEDNTDPTVADIGAASTSGQESPGEVDEEG